MNTSPPVSTCLTPSEGRIEILCLLVLEYYSNGLWVPSDFAYGIGLFFYMKRKDNYLILIANKDYNYNNKKHYYY